MQFQEGYWQQPIESLAIDYTDKVEIKSEYIIINRNGVTQTLHKFIWEHFNGPVPQDHEIDHIDGRKLNNEISNLRCVPVKVNRRNSAKRSHNKSGKNGVSYRILKGYEFWAATYTDPRDNKPKVKSFSVNKYGSDVAKQMAIDFRREVEQQLLIPAGYTDRHGQ